MPGTTSGRHGHGPIRTHVTRTLRFNGHGLPWLHGRRHRYGRQQVLGPAQVRDHGAQFGNEPARHVFEGTQLVHESELLVCPW